MERETAPSGPSIRLTLSRAAAGMASFALLALLPVAASASPAGGNADIRGTYDAPSAVGASSFPQTWHVTSENLATGAFSGVDTSPVGNFSLRGTVSGDSLTAVVNQGSYTSHGTATLTRVGNALKMRGTFTDSNGTSGTFSATIPLHGAPVSPADQVCLDSSSPGCTSSVDTSQTLDPNAPDEAFTAGCGSSTHAVRMPASATLRAGLSICDITSDLMVPPDVAALLGKVLGDFQLDAADLQNENVLGALGKLVDDLGGGPLSPGQGPSGSLLGGLNGVLSALTDATGVSQTLQSLLGSSPEAQAALDKAMRALDSSLEVSGLPQSDASNLASVLETALTGKAADLNLAGGPSGGLLSGITSVLGGALSPEARSAIADALDALSGPALPGGEQKQLADLLGSLTGPFSDLAGAGSANDSRSAQALQQAQGILDSISKAIGAGQSEPPSGTLDSAASKLQSSVLQDLGQAIDSIVKSPASSDQQATQQMLDQAQGIFDSIKTIIAPAPPAAKSAIDDLSSAAGDLSGSLTSQSLGTSDLNAADAVLDSSFAADRSTASIAAPVAATAAFQPVPVLAAVLSSKPTAADALAFKAAVKLATAHGHSALQFKARAVLMLAATAGWYQQAHRLGYDPRTGRKVGKRSASLGSARLKVAAGQRAAGHLKIDAAGRRLLLLLGLLSHHKTVTLDFTVTSKVGGKTATATKPIRVRAG